MLLSLAFFPLAYAVWVGQPAALFVLALWQAVRQLRSGRELTAGVWLGLLLIKPQYVVFLVLALAIKRRVRALAGMAATGAALAAVTLAVLGPQGVIRYVAMMRYATGFRSVDEVVAPDHMIGWRSLLVNFLPVDVSDATGSLLTLVLSAATALTLPILWHGRWTPNSPRFSVQLLATLLVTMMASFHNHPHGAALLAVPAMAACAAGALPSFAKKTVALAVTLPLPVFCLAGLNVPITSTLVTALIAAALGAIVLAESRGALPSLRGAAARRLPRWVRTAPTAPAA